MKAELVKPEYANQSDLVELANATYTASFSIEPKQENSELEAKILEESNVQLDIQTNPQEEPAYSSGQAKIGLVLKSDTSDYANMIKYEPTAPELNIKHISEAFLYDEKPTGLQGFFSPANPEIFFSVYNPDTWWHERAHQISPIAIREENEDNGEYRQTAGLKKFNLPSIGPVQSYQIGQLF